MNALIKEYRRNKKTLHRALCARGNFREFIMQIDGGGWWFERREHERLSE